MSRLRLVGALSCVALLGGLLAGCSGGSAPKPSSSHPAASASTSADATPTPTPTPSQEPWISTIATAAAESVDVYPEAGAAAPSSTVAAKDVVSLPGQIPLTFLVLAQQDGWVQVALPILAVAWLTTGRFLDATRTLERLRGQLAAAVEARTRELAGALDALNQAEKLAALGSFASGVAHEVNSPASVVTTNLRYLSEATAGGGWPGDGAEALADALASMQRITDLVRRLVDAGRTAATTVGAVAAVPCRRRNRRSAPGTAGSWVQ